MTGLVLGLSYIDFRLYPLPWLGVAVLIALAEREAPGRAFRLGYLAGFAGVALAYAWLVHVIHVFGGFPLPLALALSVPPVAWMALPLGLFTGAIGWLGVGPLGLVPPLAFTAIEFAFPSPVPWRLAHSQYLVPTLLQTGELAGPALLTFTMAWTSTALVRAARALAFRRRGAAARPRSGGEAPAILAPVALLVGVLVYGHVRLAVVRAARSEAPALRVGAVQGNVDITRKGDRRLFRRNVDDYQRLSRTIADAVDLLVWPETVVQQGVPAELRRLTAAENPFPDAPRPLLFGALTIESGSSRRRLFNSAVLLRDGAIVARYDKRILVPFGEYMPLAEHVPSLRSISPATGDFTAGSAMTLLPVNPAAQIAALICYEDIIPGPARAGVAAGATLLVNLTNDAWFGDGAEPVQHQALAAWRAVENRRDFVRATNTGLTSLIAATGEVAAVLPTFQAGTLVHEVRLLSGTTVYNTVGDLAAWAAVIGLGAVAEAKRRRLKDCR